MLPTTIFLTKGVGKHKEKLGSFEFALRNAGIAFCNLVHVSSIFPPECRLVSRKVGLEKVKPGQITYCVLSRIETNEPNRLIASAIGVAIPKDKNMYGYLSEHTAYGQTREKAGDYAEDLAAGMLASTMGSEFDVNNSYDVKKEIWRISGKIVKTQNIVQSAEGNKNGLWTTAIAAAIMLA